MKWLENDPTAELGVRILKDHLPERHHLTLDSLLSLSYQVGAAEAHGKFLDKIEKSDYLKKGGEKDVK